MNLSCISIYLCLFQCHYCALHITTVIIFTSEYMYVYINNEIMFVINMH